MTNGLVPLGGKYQNAYGALFCADCKKFLRYEDDPILVERCPRCNTKVDWDHKMKYVDGKWIKVKK